jgi:plasmid stability protein
MTTLTIRNIDPAIKSKLRMTAAAHGRSMEEEIRTILRNVLAPQPMMTGGLGSRIHARFAAIGGVDLDIPARTDMPRTANFDSSTPA